LPGFDPENAYELDRDDFVDMVAKTSFAAHKGKHRYALNGVLLVIKPDRIEMVATDGRRLAHAQRKTKNPAGSDVSIIVPTKALDEIIKVLTDEDEKVGLNIVDDKLVVARTSRAILSSRLVEGHFPPYESVIPKDNDKKVDLDRERLHSAVRRAALVTTEESGTVALSFASNKLSVHSAAPEKGEAQVSLAVDYGGPDIEVNFNPTFLVEFLRAVADETVRLEFRDSSSAGLFRAGKDFLYVVMPVSKE